MSDHGCINFVLCTQDETEHFLINVVNNSKTYLGLCQWGPEWGKVFKNGPSKICGRQPLKNFK